MRLQFWGVRGSLPAPGPATVRYGGNTLCVALRCGPHLLILDGGSGLRELGVSLASPVEADVLLSHAHLDHVCGVPFFRPMYSARSVLRFWGGGLVPARGIEQALLGSWQAPLMPSLETAFKAAITFHDLRPGEDLELHPGLRMAVIGLRHPGGALGYRFTWRGRSVCYITDVEHEPSGPAPALVRFIRGADLLITDASYTDEEYAARVGWGHSTWQGAVRLADESEVGRLVLVHHDPDHDDAAMDRIASEASMRRAGTITAQEGLTLKL